MEPGLRRYYSLAVATLGFVVLGVSLFNYPTISSLVSHQFGLSDTESGLLTSAYALTYTIVQIPTGIITDRIGGPKTLLIALAITTAAPFLFIFGNSYDAALVSRAVAGLGSGMVLPGGVRLLSSTFSEKELHRAMGILGTGWGGSQSLAYLVLPLLIFGEDWHPPLEFTIGICLVVTLMAILPVKWGTASTSPGTSVKVDVRGLLTKRLFVLSLANFTSLVVTVGILAWLPNFLTASLSVNEVEAGRIIAVIGVTGVASSFAGGVLSQKIGPRPVIFTSMVLLVVVPYFLATSTSWPDALLWIALLGIGGNIYFGPLTALVPYSSKQGPDVAGISFGVFNTISNIGNFLSPIIIGFALDATGSYVVGFTALGIIGITGVVASLMVTGGKHA
jgi:predicted MFS family arabinose efflux permease